MSNITDSNLARIVAADASCPHCGRKPNVHRRTLGKKSVDFLRELRKEGLTATNIRKAYDTPAHVPKGSSDPASLTALLGLSDNTIHGKGSGDYVLTLLGEKFLAGEARVPGWVETLDSKVYRVGPPVVHIDDVDPPSLF